ncbi:MAG: helix-turn-helix domain-containing protein [Rhodococcus sp. (in: high G+C Gram-positive bacteria)]
MGHETEVEVDVGSWVRELRLDAPSHIAPVCLPQTVARVGAIIGVDAVEWGVQHAKEIAEANIVEFPHIGGGPAQLDTLRLGVESATLSMLECMYEGSVSDSTLPYESESQIRDFVHRRITLTDQWAMIRQGHAALVRRLMAACAQLTAEPERSSRLLAVTDIAFDFIDAYWVEVARAYEGEQQRFDESALISRETALRALLDGDETDLGEVGRRLRYDVVHRWHIALVFSRIAPGEWDELLTNAAREALVALGARQVLLVPRGHAVLWAFGNSPAPIDSEWGWRPPDSVGMAVGDPGWDAAGFRTSHERAVVAHRLANYVRGDSSVTHYRDIDLLDLLLTDRERAREFVDYELGDLADPGAGTAELRRTVATYLDNHNTRATAATLFVARNTVTYRLRKAETLIGHSLTARSLQARVALYLAELFHLDED